MPVFVELVVVELAVTVSVGAVLAFVSGLMAPSKQNAQRRSPLGCRSCGLIRAIEAGPDPVHASQGRQ